MRLSPFHNLFYLAAYPVRAKDNGAKACIMLKTIDSQLTTRTAPSRATKGALAALALSMLLSSLGVSSINVALPELTVAFSASFPQVQWITIAYLVAVTTFILLVGRLGDLLGRRRLLLAGIGLFVTASAFCALAETLWVLIAARALQGLGAAAMMALTMAFVSQAVPKDRTGSAMGLLGTMSALGTALGPSLGGLLLAGPGWRSIFLINLPLGLLALVLGRRYLPDDKKTAATGAAGWASFDIPGTVFLVVTLAAYTLAMTVGHGRFGMANAGLFLTSGLGLAAFVWAERGVARPLIDLALLRDPALAAGLAMNMLVATVMMTTLVVGPFYLSGALGLHAAAMGAVLSAGPVVSALSGVPSGRAVDRLGSRWTTLAGIGAITLGAALLSVVPQGFGIAGYLGPLVIVTMGYALFQAANNTAVLAGVAEGQRGLFSGLLNLSRNLGLVTGASVMGAVFAQATGGADVTAAPPAGIAGGLHVTFAVAAGLMLVALVLAMQVRLRLAKGWYRLNRSS